MQVPRQRKNDRFPAETNEFERRSATLLPATTTTATMAEEVDTNDKAAMESLAQNLLEVRVGVRLIGGAVARRPRDNWRRG